MLVLLSLALAAPRPADPVEARIAYPLRRALTLVEAGRVGDVRLPHAEASDAVSVVLEPAGDADLLAAIGATGLPVEATAAGRVQVWVPWERLREVAALPGVDRVRLPWRARPKEVISEGYAAVMETDWHLQGLTGAGVRVGVVDVGFAGLERLAGEEIPAGVLTDFSRGDVDATDHGTAVTEILVDFAPDAEYYLATFSTDVEFGELMELFVEADVDVVNGSIGFDNVWHADGTSSLTQYADWAVGQGVAYFAAAGNENDKYRVGALSYDTDGTSIRIAGDSRMWVQAPGGQAWVSLRWSEPFGEAAQDIDLALFDEEGTLCGVSEDDQDGAGWPYEAVYADCGTPWVAAVPYSVNGVADLDGLEGYLYAYDGLDEAAWTNTEDLTLPGDTREGISVGAYYADEDTIAWYSSRGPTNDGRTKPDVVAPTAVSTATYGRSAFEGSSSATPHAAGLGALYLQATGERRRPARLKEWMLDEARDLGDAGPDDVYGHGAIRAREIPEGMACGCAATDGARAGAAVAGLALLAARRRRRR